MRVNTEVDSWPIKAHERQRHDMLENPPCCECSIVAQASALFEVDIVLVVPEMAVMTGVLYFVTDEVHKQNRTQGMPYPHIISA